MAQHLHRCKGKSVREKIGILGGTFNPPHLGHLALAEYAQSALKLDRVVFVPCNLPAHKQNGNLVSGALRFLMLKAAIRGNVRFEVSDVELKRRGISYTIDTVRFFKRKVPYGSLYLIIGSDLVSGLATWKEIDQLRQLVTFVVAQRNGERIQKGNGFIFLDFPHLEISSSLIRLLIRKRQAVRYLVGSGVYSLIKRHNLYLRKS